ncbi:MAG: hypothetical protein QHJ82_04825 [Verrucomicrobiota bacterium]|nr:hypothetical protein [Verrucomicrobiota bacterium]
MFQEGRLTQLEAARRNLALEADLRRSALKLEAAELHSKFRNAQPGRFAIPLLKPALVLSGILIGALAGRKHGKLTPWVPAALGILRFLRRRV